MSKVEARNLPPLREVRKKMDSEEYSIDTLTKKQAEQFADDAAMLANFWEDHPKLWIKGSYQSGQKVCNVGLLEVAAGSRSIDGNGQDEMIRSYGFSNIAKESYFGMRRYLLIGLNDNAKTNMATDVVGLRFIADVLYHVAVGWTAKEATSEVWKQYGFDKLSKKAVAEATQQHAHEVKLAQVRKARALAKQRGYKTVKAMRADGWKREFDNAA